MAYYSAVAVGGGGGGGGGDGGDGGILLDQLIETEYSSSLYSSYLLSTLPFCCCCCCCYCHCPCHLDSADEFT